MARNLEGAPPISPGIFEPNALRRGDRITAQQQNQMVDRALGDIVAGQGISLERRGRNTVINAVPQRNMAIPGFTIRAVTEFPEIYEYMPLTFVKRYETGIGWTIWHAQGPDDTYDGDTFWAPAFGRWTDLTGEVGT